MMANKIIAGKADGDEEMDQGEAKEDAKYELEADAPPDLLRPPGMQEGGMTDDAAPNLLRPPGMHEGGVMDDAPP